MARFLDTLELHPLDNGTVVGEILARSETTDVVDAHLVATAVRLAEPILTGDVTDLELLASSLQDRWPRIYGWPRRQS